MEFKTKHDQRSERVESVDLHPKEPWILTSLHSGIVSVWNHKSQTMVKSSVVTQLPVRSAKFIAREQWVVAGADDKYIRLYDYNTMDIVKAFNAHDGNIRCLTVHPTLPYVLSSSDDKLIKLWDWAKDWACIRIFEGHSRSVMQVTFDPGDTNIFASASRDNTVKIWNVASLVPISTVETDNTRLSNCVDYFPGGDKPYLIIGSDGGLAEIWDYHSKECVESLELEDDTHKVSAVCFHPEIPIIITGSEDGRVNIWDATTYELENSLQFNIGGVCAIGCIKGSRRVVFGLVGGSVMIKVGREVPVASMDSSGKIIWLRYDKVKTIKLESVGADYEVNNGKIISLAVEELGNCCPYLQGLKHSRNGMFVAVCGDGKYVIYTASRWKERSSGPGLELVWSSDGEFAVRESTSKIVLFGKRFGKKKSFRPTFSAEHIYGGTLLAVCDNEVICFYDWAKCRVIKLFKLKVKDIYWSEIGDLLALATDTSIRIYKYNKGVVSTYLNRGGPALARGVAGAFQQLYNINRQARTGLWVKDCIIYTDSSWKLNCSVYGRETTMFSLDRPMYLLGYMANQNSVYLIDREFKITGYTIPPVLLIKYQTLVMRGDFERAKIILPLILKNHRDRSMCRITELPDDILELILARLTLRDTQICKRVSKYFYRVVGSCGTFSLRERTHAGPLALVYNSGRRIRLKFLLSEFNEEETIENGLDVPLDAIEFIGSCKGICLYQGNVENLYICNPLTKEFVILFGEESTKESKRLKYWDSISAPKSLYKIGATNDLTFKIVKFTERREDTMTVEVFSPMDLGDAWRFSGECKMDLPSMHRVVSEMHLFEESFYWYYEGKISTYDLRNENLGTISLPPIGYATSNLRIGSLGTKLCVFNFQNMHLVEVWGAEPWSILYNLNLGGRSIVPLPLCFWRDETKFLTKTFSRKFDSPNIPLETYMKIQTYDPQIASLSKPEFEINLPYTPNILEVYSPSFMALRHIISKTRIVRKQKRFL